MIRQIIQKLSDKGDQYIKYSKSIDYVNQQSAF